MNKTLPLLALLSASAGFAQTAPNVARQPVLQHSVEASFVTSSSLLAGYGDFSGYNLAARAYVWRNVFVALERYSATADVVLGKPVEMDASRFGYGLGATFQVGPGLLAASYTLGKIKFDISGIGSEEADQDRASLTYSLPVANGLQASIGVTQHRNDTVKDSTAYILGVGYEFGNGLGVLASYSPDGADIGLDNFTENVFTLGARYSF